MSEVSNYILRISGKAELPEDIEIGANYHTSLEVSVVSCTESDNENGTTSKTYLFKPIKIELLDPKGKTLKLKDTRRESQKTRVTAYAVWLQNNDPTPFEEFYRKLNVAFRVNMDDIITNYLK